MGVSQQLLLSIGSQLRVSLPPRFEAFVSAEEFGTGNLGASSSIELVFNNTGTFDFIRSAFGTIRDPIAPFQTSGNWIQGGSPNQFSIRVNVQSGNLQLSPVNQWLSLNNTYTWGLFATASGDSAASASAVGNIEIARTTNLSQVIASSSFAFSASARSSTGNIQ